MLAFKPARVPATALTLFALILALVAIVPSVSHPQTASAQGFPPYCSGGYISNGTTCVFSGGSNCPYAGYPGCTTGYGTCTYGTAGCINGVCQGGYISNGAGSCILSGAGTCTYGTTGCINGVCQGGYVSNGAGSCILSGAGTCTYGTTGCINGVCQGGYISNGAGSCILSGAGTCPAGTTWNGSSCLATGAAIGGTIVQTPLNTGCNLVVVAFGTGATPQQVATATANPSAVISIWSWDNTRQKWMGFFPGQSAGASDLQTLPARAAVFVCVNSPTTLTAP